MQAAAPSSSEARSRAALYGLLARALAREADAGLVAFLREPEVRELAGGEEAPDDSEDLESLAEEFARLFLVPPGHIPPVESFHVGGLGQPPETFEPALQGPAAREVRAFYAEADLAAEAGTGLPPDHAATELHALELLCRAEAGAVEAGDAARVETLRRTTARFLREHPLRWMPRFCAEIAERTRSRFYRWIVRTAAAFLASENQECNTGSALEEEATQWT